MRRRRSIVGLVLASLAIAACESGPSASGSSDRTGWTGQADDRSLRPRNSVPSSTP